MYTFILYIIYHLLFNLCKYKSYITISYTFWLLRTGFIIIYSVARYIPKNVFKAGIRQSHDARHSWKCQGCKLMYLLPFPNIPNILSLNHSWWRHALNWTYTVHCLLLKIHNLDSKIAIFLLCYCLMRKKFYIIFIFDNWTLDFEICPPSSHSLKDSLNVYV